MAVLDPIRVEILNSDTKTVRFIYFEISNKLFSPFGTSSCCYLKTHLIFNHFLAGLKGMVIMGLMSS